MRKSWIAGVAAALCLACPAAAGAIETPAMTFEGGPVMSRYDTVEVVWSRGGTTAEGSILSGIAGFLGDVGAASGATDNVFSTLAQYATVGLAEKGNVTAYASKYLGSGTVAPATGEDIEVSQLETTLDQAVEAGVLPAPTTDANGGSRRPTTCS
jgi:hypothetical protein